jgi:hypothetical protein
MRLRDGYTATLHWSALIKKTSLHYATYTVTFPFGVKTFVASATGTINVTDDQGCGAVPPACNFAGVLTTSNVGPFLRWATAPAPPTGYIGNAAAEHTITGSPFNTNFLRIDGPNVGGPGVNTIQTNLFTIVGKIFNGVLATALTIDRTSFARSGTGSEIDLFAHSVGSGDGDVERGPQRHVPRRPRP